jgi:dihydroneopterin aldolase
MDKVFVTQLAIDTVIGVYDWEKTITQTLLIDMELDSDLQLAGNTDALVHTLDYGVICQQVTAMVQAQPLELIETVAERIAALLLNNFATSRVLVRVSKPSAVPQAKTVGVQIVRSRPA